MDRENLRWGGAVCPIRVFGFEGTWTGLPVAAGLRWKEGPRSLRADVPVLPQAAPGAFARCVYRSESPRVAVSGPDVRRSGDCGIRAVFGLRPADRGGGPETQRQSGPAQGGGLAGERFPP